ncbi:MAG: histidine kinase, partial [Spirochaetota bacterium]
MSDAAGKTILLIEDEALIALAESKALEKYGYKVLTAFTGGKAVGLALADEAIDFMGNDLGWGVDGTVAARWILEGRERPLDFLS